MSTRTRIIVTYEKHFIRTGYQAIAELTQRTMSNGWKIAMQTAGLHGMSKKEKLLTLAQRLPPGFKLTLIQEPKGTRKNRSLYWKKRAEVID